jgi:hypothetical protein
MQLRILKQYLKKNNAEQSEVSKQRILHANVVLEYTPKPVDQGALQILIAGCLGAGICSRVAARADPRLGALQLAPACYGALARITA